MRTLTYASVETTPQRRGPTKGEKCQKSKLQSLGKNGTVWQDAAPSEILELEEIEMLAEYEAYEMYDEMLDQCYEPLQHERA